MLKCENEGSCEQKKDGSGVECICKPGFAGTLCETSTPTGKRLWDKTMSQYVALFVALLPEVATL